MTDKIEKKIDGLELRMKKQISNQFDLMRKEIDRLLDGTAAKPGILRRLDEIVKLQKKK